MGQSIVIQRSGLSVALCIHQLCRRSRRASSGEHAYRRKHGPMMWRWLAPTCSNSASWAELLSIMLLVDAKRGSVVDYGGLWVTSLVS